MSRPSSQPGSKKGSTPGTPTTEKRKTVVFDVGLTSPSKIHDCLSGIIEYPSTKYVEPPFKSLEKRQSSLKDDKTKSDVKAKGSTAGNKQEVLENPGLAKNSISPVFEKKITITPSESATNAAENERQPPVRVESEPKQSIPNDKPLPDENQSPSAPVKEETNQESPDEVEASNSRPITPQPGSQPSTRPQTPIITGDYKAGDYTYGGVFGPCHIPTDCYNAPDFILPDNYHIDSMDCVHQARELPNACHKINTQPRGNRGDDGDRSKLEKGKGNSRVPNRFISKWEVVKPYQPMFDLDIEVTSQREANDARVDTSSVVANVKTTKKIKKKVVEEPESAPDKRPCYMVPVPKKSYVDKFHRLSHPVKEDQLNRADAGYWDSFSNLSSDMDVRKNH